MCAGSDACFLAITTLFGAAWSTAVTMAGQTRKESHKKKNHSTQFDLLGSTATTV